MNGTQPNSLKYAKVIVKFYNANEAKKVDPSAGIIKAPDVIRSLGEYFKEAAYTVPVGENGKVTGWRRSNLTIQGALLYAIFVFQSIIYFFSYVKRFFYIIALAIMAPAIVILDFLSKSLS